jgi:hypothetical protein
MTSGVQASEDRIPWEAHSGSQQRASGPAILSPGENRFADGSPQPVSGLVPQLEDGLPVSSDPSSHGHHQTEPPSGKVLAPEPEPPRRAHAISAPAEVHHPHRPLSHQAPQPEYSLNVKSIGPSAPVPVPATNLELDTTAPLRAMRDHTDSEALVALESLREEASSRQSVQSLSVPPSRPEPVPLQPPTGGQAATETGENIWGQSFKVEWIKTERLPFYRTRHLRNPWNHGREVKVSRDGTELEPTVGRELLVEWDRPPPDPGEIMKTAGAGRRSGRPAPP